MAASRTLRLRAELPRSFSTWCRKAPTSGASRSATHQLRNCGQVPVRIAHLGVAEVGRQHGELRIDGDARPVPTHERGHRQSVSQVVEPRSMTVAACGDAETDLAG